MRGFAPGGMGPRDISDLINLAGNGLGGTTYFGGSAEIQFPIFGLPKEVGLKGALFADAGTEFGFQGQTNYSSLCSATAYWRRPAAGHTGHATRPVSTRRATA